MKSNFIIVNVPLAGGRVNDNPGVVLGNLGRRDQPGAAEPIGPAERSGIVLANAVLFEGGEYPGRYELAVGARRQWWLARVVPSFRTKLLTTQHLG